MLHYYSFNQYLKEKHDKKIWRIPLSTGYPCPNRINGKTGCTFCDGKSFLPFYLQENEKLEDQVEKGIKAFSARYKVADFYGYFQENTNTYGPIEELIKKFQYILNLENMRGLIISTRPDYVYLKIIEKINDLNKAYNKDIWLELGLQSVYDSTLKRINRNHTYSDFKNAIKVIKDNSDIKITVHIIIGLPGESISMMEEGIRILFNDNKIDGIKFRLLEIISGTDIEIDFKNNRNDFFEFDVDSYSSLLCNLLELIPGNVVIMRLLNSPSIKILCRGNKILSKQEILDKINKELEKRGTGQGKLWCK